MKGPYTNHSEAGRLDGEWSPSYVPPATVSDAWGWGFPFLIEVGKSIKVEVKREGCPTSLLGRVGWAEEGNEDLLAAVMRRLGVGGQQSWRL